MTALTAFTLAETTVTIIVENAFLMGFVLFCVVLLQHSGFYAPIPYTVANEPLTIPNKDLIHMSPLTSAPETFSQVLVVSTLAKPLVS